MEVLRNHYSNSRQPFPHPHSELDQQTKHAIYTSKTHKSSPAYNGQVQLEHLLTETTHNY